MLLPVEFIKAVARNGNYGVTMFFVVSGYLITSTTLRRHGSLGHVDRRSFVPRGATPEVYKLPAMGFFVAASVVVAWGVARFCSEPMNARLRGLLLRRVR